VVRAVNGRLVLFLEVIGVLIDIDPSALRRTKWHEYAVRFLLGGAITAAAGVIAKKCGPEIGGLFLAFPAIFPAAATLAQKHEIQKKNEKGLSGMQRGVDAAGAQTAGAAIGSTGLLAFAAVIWGFIGRSSPWVALPLAVFAWATVAVAVWFARKGANLCARSPQV
jgi:hypothetical protein